MSHPTVPYFRTYEDKAGRWRWQFRSTNERITADSGQGYASESECKRAIERIRRDVPRSVTL